MIGITPRSGNRVEVPQQGIPKAVFFSRRDRVGELCSLLFLLPFQPHVFQVCFSKCLNLQRTQFASLLCTVPPSYANQYTQPRSSPGKYDYTQFYNPYNTCERFHFIVPGVLSMIESSYCTPAPQPASSYPTYENSERYSPQPPYGTYPTRASPAIPANPQDSRKLPPLATSPNAGGERWQQSSYIPTSSNYQGGGIRSPTASYPTAYAGYQTSHQTGAYTYHLPTGESMHPHVPSMNTQVHVSGYDTMDPSRPDPRSSSPYSRSSSHVSPPTYTPPPVSPTSADEPTIKKKRKRADAAQLKVLNETYNRTAFPSTEERLALAKALDMSARSVQIW